MITVTDYTLSNDDGEDAMTLKERMEQAMERVVRAKQELSAAQADFDALYTRVEGRRDKRRTRPNGTAHSSGETNLADELLNRIVTYLGQHSGEHHYKTIAKALGADPQVVRVSMYKLQKREDVVKGKLRATWTSKTHKKHAPQGEAEGRA